MAVIAKVETEYVSVQGLRQQCGKWICIERGCSRYGQEQRVLLPTSNALAEDEVQPYKGAGARWS